jgi:hypothetical protein
MTFCNLVGVYKFLEGTLYLHTSHFWQPITRLARCHSPEDHNLNECSGCCTDMFIMETESDGNINKQNYMLKIVLIYQWLLH